MNHRVIPRGYFVLQRGFYPTALGAFGSEKFFMSRSFGKHGKEILNLVSSLLYSVGMSLPKTRTAAFYDYGVDLSKYASDTSK
jgi:hypothetical protein